MLHRPKRFAEFGVFQLDLDERVLFRDQRVIPLPPKDLETLLILVENQGRIVEKRELMERIWPGIFVEEGNLTRHIFNLRQILCDGSDSSFYIQTVPKRGYRFASPVVIKMQCDPSAINVPEAGQSPSTVPPPAYAALPSELHLSSHRKRNLLRFGSAVALALVLLLIGAKYGILRYFSSHPSETLPAVMLAILPVENLTGDSTQDYASDGLTEELITQLGKLDPQHLGVIARTSSMAYKKTDKTVSQISRELGADYALEAGFRKSGDHLRFTVQLIRIRDQTCLWVQDYDEQKGDLIAMQGAIGLAVAEQVGVRLSSTTQFRAAQPRFLKSESYQQYLLGRYHLNMRSKEGLEKSLEDFHQAIALDPNNAPAYAGLADSFNMMTFYGYVPGAIGIVRAKDSAEKAIAIDEKLAEGHAALAYVQFMWLWDWASAEQEFRRAIELDRNYVPAHHWYALYLASRGRFGEADEEIKVAEILDPRSLIVKTARAWIYYFARQPDLARQECLAALQMDQNFMVAHAVLGLSYEESDRYDQAIREFREALNLSKIKSPTYLGYLGHAYAAAGRRQEAREVLQELDELAKEGYGGQINKAVVYAALDEKDQAIKTLRNAIAQNDGGAIWLRVNPELDNLRHMPEFAEVLPRQASRN